MRDVPALRHEVPQGTRIVSCFAEPPATKDVMLRTAVAASADRTARVGGDKRVSNARLDSMVTCAASALIRMSFVKG